VSGYLSERYAEGASLQEALALAVAALGHSSNERGETEDRVIPSKDLEVAVLDRTRSQPRKFARIGPFRLEALLGDRGPTTPSSDDGPGHDNHAPGAGTSDGQPDDPKDPTDQVSGDVPPLEDPVAPEDPPVAPPPTAPPA
jgi:proteasome alpha subunit